MTYAFTYLQLQFYHCKFVFDFGSSRIPFEFNIFNIKELCQIKKRTTHYKYFEKYYQNIKEKITSITFDQYFTIYLKGFEMMCNRIYVRNIFCRN